MTMVVEKQIGGRPVRLQYVRLFRRGRSPFYRVLGTYLDGPETFSMTQGEFAKWTTALERQEARP